MNPKGHTAIVTGGGSGLGEATARALAAAGASVAIFDLGLDAAEKVASDIGGIALKCDVADAISVETALAQTIEQLASPRILVNCAGIAIASKTLGRDGPHPLDAFRKVVEVNLIGTFNTIRLVADRMASLDPLDGGERGVIVNTASIAAYDGQIGQAAYASSKGGVVGMTLPIAREFAKLGIRVMTIAPGIFSTAMLRGLPQEAQDSLGASVPFPSRLGDPSEYAALALHIVGNQMLNGEVIRLDGALRMAPR
ncbi:MAG: SDR family NAD(P)-dependent oxidoreductase [Alphaproteobacteria bacterium]|jgi:NAD(P)-dependent dehydrogenase (short-subunit alcohol dehydrogenase family)|nr:SDR family NAD(P)-dependent oxidoreductase [Alphaproteobacteria bacterium]MBU0803067.1 SDR family NAD(P)-dependent oxidoreductase [Alphaproteobacteria bacterium]MBU0870822.1 SDR family NAD(P)-dependent oxidoreductase [Alphaproteobacteria bacterium]MBU1403741.1 SDR family NAD(P)-dependent oxidoreductase [Alphaproteobacteria bacterium]MBU1589576.1 SDR family NAD(P)-dependent oxidoreductase [Alphaproteobacteria bacterium]